MTKQLRELIGEILHEYQPISGRETGAEMSMRSSSDTRRERGGDEERGGREEETRERGGREEGAERERDISRQGCCKMIRRSRVVVRTVNGLNMMHDI